MNTDIKIKQLKKIPSLLLYPRQSVANYLFFDPFNLIKSPRADTSGSAFRGKAYFIRASITA
jgi:hypothetical protein